MAIDYTVRANVIAIKSDAPKSADTFLVDTNVWYWLAYSKASQNALPYQMSDYPSYAKAALGAGARVFQSTLSLAELSHLIEKAEREIYQAENRPVNAKEYRHNNAGERDSVVAEIEAAYGLVTTLAEPLTATIDANTADAALNRLQTERVDGYDLFILESMRINGVVQIITDDGDFCTVPGIQVFTANRSVIQAAESQGKLVRRS
ncbi:MAG: PIN domain-containing protein [Aminobacteriaceae bacterium]